MATRVHRTRLGATEYARQLASRFGCGREFDPVECWTVQSEGKPRRVLVKMVRGHCDNRHSSYDYAETTDGASISARYLFPARTHKRPALIEMEDDFGRFRDWASDPKA